MKIKVCGLKEPANIKALVALKPDYMGFICYGMSPRFIAELPPDVLEQLPKSTFKTAVFVDESLDKINLLIDEYGFNAIQLHGNESPEFCQALRGRVKVFKAFGLDQDFDFSVLEPYAAYVDYFLFDTKTDLHGGSGRTFNWDILQNYKLDVPFFLSGGLSPENIAEISGVKHPQFFGVDLNSKFETSPGVKDINKLRKAFELLRQESDHEI